MENTQYELRQIAAQIYNQIGYIDQSSTLDGLSSRISSLKNFVEQFSQQATVKANQLLHDYEQKQGERAAEKYRDEITDHVKSLIHEYTDLIMK